MMLIGIFIFLLLQFQTWIFCMMLHKDGYEQEISDRAQEEYLKNWMAKKRKK